MHNILILGSGPIAELSALPFDEIYYANGAISRSLDIKADIKRQNLVLSDIIFTERNHGCKKVKSMLEKIVLDDLVIYQTKKNLNLKIFNDLKVLDVQYKSYSYVGRYRRSLLVLKSVNFTKVLVYLLQQTGVKKTITEILYFLWKGNFRPLKVSTGCLALLEAVNGAQNDSQFYLAGISFSDNGSHFYDEEFPFVGHGNQDRLMLKTLRSDIRSRTTIL